MYGAEDEKISLECFLKSIISSVSGSKREFFLRRIKSVIKETGSEDEKVDFGEFHAFQCYLENIDSLKYKVAQYRFIDYEMFVAEIKEFNKRNATCKEKKIGISDSQIKALFLLLDSDESGELEPEEIMGVFQQKMLLGRNRELEVRDEMVEKANLYLKKGQAFFRERIGHWF